MGRTEVLREARPKMKSNRDDDVIEAAVSVMSERGYAATSVQEVADRVGVLKGSLYHYFSSKEELLFRILEESHAENRAISDDVRLLRLSPLDELCEYARRLALWYLANVERANIYFSEARHLTGDRRSSMVEAGRRFEKHILELVEAGRAAGEITTETDTHLLTHFVMSSLNSVRSWRTPSSAPVGEEAIASSFVVLLRRAIAAAPHGS